MTLAQYLARTIAKARHGTDAHWANYMSAAEAVQKLYTPTLEFYATRENWQTDWQERNPCLDDAGARARNLLVQPEARNE